MANGNDNDGITGKLLAPVEKLTNVMKGLKEASEALVKPLDSIAKEGDKITTAFGAASGFKTFKEAALGLDELRANLQAATGQGIKYRDMSVELQAELAGLGVSTTDAAGAFETLHSSFSEFTLLAPKSQKAIAKQTAAFTKLGISIGESTANYDILIKGMKVNEKSATKMQKNMAKLALSIGVAPKQMAKDFAAAAPILARYGKGGVKVFNEMAVQSKATGLSVQKLLDIAGGFDTFSDAADKAGQLNAMLGGNLLNSVDMLVASESERVDMIRQAVAATGQSWDSLDRFQKKAIAGTVGISDMTDAMRLFGTEQASLDDLKKKADPAIVAQQDLTKAMEHATSIASRFMGVFDKMSNIYGRTLEPIFRKISIFLTGKKGLGAAESIMKKFAKGIKTVAKWWNSFDPKLIKNVAQLVFQATAFSFALRQVQQVASPLMSLLSNKWLIIGAGIFSVIKYWGNFKKLLQEIKGYLKPLDKEMMAFFKRHKDNSIVSGFAAAYVWIKDKIPYALDQLSLWFEANKPKMIAFFKDIKKSVGGFMGGLWDDFQGSKGVFKGGMIKTIGRWADSILSVFSMIKQAVMNLVGKLALAMGYMPGSSLSIEEGKALQESIALGGKMSPKEILAATDRKARFGGDYRKLQGLRVAAGGDEHDRFTGDENNFSLGEAISDHFFKNHNGGLITARPGEANQNGEVVRTLQTGEFVMSRDMVQQMSEGGSSQPIILKLELHADGLKKEIGEIATSAVQSRLKPDAFQLSIPSLTTI